jgi:hypothetical protein
VKQLLPEQIKFGPTIALTLEQLEFGDVSFDGAIAVWQLQGSEQFSFLPCKRGCKVSYDLDHVPFFVGRGLYFQAFDRLYKAFQEFLQALFIARRVYPIAYNKWIHEQVAVRLGLPELYAQLPKILEITRLESDVTA